MLVTIKQGDFESLNDVSLIWACIEPTITQIRGKSYIVKSEAYATLNPGQRALLMFQVLYGHTSNGIEEFYFHLSYLLSNKDVWSQLKKGMQYFEDFDMLQILEDMDVIFQSMKTEEFKNNTEQRNTLITDIDRNAELFASMNLLNKSFSVTLLSTIQRVAAYIRNNANEFVQLID
ncbi:DMP19 family protein [Acetanaerobacterium elongatum]|uniref:DNA mimic protein DMP19 C-terminal domain-containing protein n=1 Tax=Acetanaerobacterium elongatum TaxID=258515 RepID=A0A1G9WM99_9FIRM|nr:hypothetical protein [Acetanaerobacterium elongatum]SDM85477.1 hypothetical protein SAMN05192585_10655 [Acetanaerobacterium elongatum]